MKRSMSLLAGAAFALSAAPAVVRAQPGHRPAAQYPRAFQADSPWNTPTHS